MENLQEVIVGKRPELDTPGQTLSAELRELGLISGNVRVLNRYIVKGMGPVDFADAVTKVFSDPSADLVHDSLEEAAAGDQVLILELLPGQFDMRANAATESIQLIHGNFAAQVRHQTIILFREELTSQQWEHLQTHLINPVEMRRGAEAVSFVEERPSQEQPPVYVGFTALDESGLKDFYAAHQLAMSLADLEVIQRHFAAIGRDPSETELKVLDTYWSDHCRHTTFQTELTDIAFAPGTEREQTTYETYREWRRQLGRDQKPQTLMDLATLGTRVLKAAGQAGDVDESDEINACSIIREIRTPEGRQPYLIQFKNETHNHPTEIEPFGGAATCLGGAIRDPLAGRAYVYQAMRVTGAADPTQAEAATLPGKLPQRTISLQAARGYSSYGNQIGLAAGIVHEIFHPGYVAKRMEVGAVIGSAPLASVDRRTPDPGDLVLLVGGRTGRDGVGGATGSSKSHDETSMETSGSEVQKGNAPTERKLQRLIRNDELRRLIKRCNDFGAGGVSVAVGELAPGLVIDLDAVPLKYQGLSATETAVSESQERMAMVIAPGDLERFRSYLDEENLESAIIARVTADPRLIMTWRGASVVDLDREFLDSAGARSSQSIVIEPARKQPQPIPTEVTRQAILDHLTTLEGQSQKSLHEYFDSTNGCATVTLPYGGLRQESEAAHMAALIPVADGVSADASIMTYGFDPYLAEADQYAGAYLAVAESLARLAAAGADPAMARLSFQEYFQKLGTDAAIWGKPMKSLLGALQAQLDFGVPAIGGKDSMSGSFGDIHVPPTLISFAVTTMPGEHVLGNVLAGEGTLWHIPARWQDGLPQADHLTAAAGLIRAANEAGLLQAADTASRGLVPALLNMAWGNESGFNVTIPDEAFVRRPVDFIVQLRPDQTAQWRQLARDAGVEIHQLGCLTQDPKVTINGVSLTLSETLEAAHARISPIFRRSKKTGATLENLNHTAAPLIIPKGFGVARPKALITVFPGSNCEYDLVRAFRSAGADPEVFVFRNRDAADLKASAQSLSQAIASSQILMIPGGFSAGDEPDGSGKFIANALRSPAIAGAITDLLETRSGLLLGICNGFQALVRLGLLPEGRITEPHEAMPMLALNEIGRHMDTIARVRVASNASPWLRHVNPGEVYAVPISHGEGRFMAPPEVLDELKANGQIITQYCDDQGNATMAAPDNPNGSQLAIEGIISKDGRVLGKMGHNERWQKGLLRNYPGTFDMQLFRSGVEYFKE